MKDLRKVNRNLKLEVKIVGYEDKIMANKITIDYLNKDFMITENLKDLEIAQVYFSFDTELKEDTKLTVDSLLKLIDNINNDKVSFMFDDGNDNWTVTNYEVDIYENKAILTIKVDIEKINTLPIFNASADYLNYKDIDEVVKFIYKDFKEEIHRYLNIKTEGDFYFVLSPDNNENNFKSWENAMGYASCFVEAKVLQMAYDNQIKFIKENYDADFEVA